jgi:DNA-binding transcriptional LysR family regulator
MKGLKSGQLLLGTIDAASIYILPKVFSRFKELYPGIEINLEVASTVPLLKNLEKGGLDIVCATLPLDLSKEYKIYPIFREPIVFITPRGHPLAGISNLNCSKLSSYPFILFHQESITRGIIEEALLKKGVSIKVSMAIDSQEAIKHLVASGLGISALPLKTVEQDIENGNLEVLNIKGISLEREIGLILPVKRYLPITLRAFLGVLRLVLDVNLPNEYCLGK